MPESADRLRQALERVRKGVSHVEANAYELGLTLLLDGFPRPDVEAALFLYFEKIAAESKQSEWVNSTARKMMRQVIGKALDRAEGNVAKRRIQ